MRAVLSLGIEDRGLRGAVWLLGSAALSLAGSVGFEAFMLTFAVFAALLVARLGEEM